MKKILNFKVVGAFSLAIMLLVGVLFTAVGSAAAGFYLAPGSQTVTTGSNFNVAIRVNSSGPVDTVQVHITYPSDKLQLVGSISYAGSPLDAHASQSTTAGDISFIAYTTGSVPSGDILVATVAFAPIATGTANINFANDTAAASSGSDVTGTKAGGTYTIQAPTPTPNPTPSGGGGTTTPSSGGSSSSKPGTTTTTPSRGTSTSTGGATSSTPTTSGTGAVVSVNGNSATQVPASGEAATVQKSSKKYWIIGGIAAAALLAGVAVAFVVVKKKGLLGFMHGGIKGFDNGVYTATPAVPSSTKPSSFVSDNLASGERSTVVRDELLDKVQGQPAHKPGETIQPTQVHSQGDHDA